MIRRHKNILQILITLSLSILVLLVIIRITTNDGRSIYYEPKYQRLEQKKKEASLEEKLDTDPPRKVPEIEFIQRELPNVPFDFWINYNKLNADENAKCNQYPYVYGLNYHNIYWQTYKLENITFQLYGAYYDKRSRLPGRPVVRLLAMLDHNGKTQLPPNYCQLWFDNEIEPTVVPVQENFFIYPPYWGILQNYLYPYLITCSPLPESDNRIPRTISLITSDCETATNNLRVWFEEPQIPESADSFGVCVKGLNFPYNDISANLIEWLELQRILGASKVYMYHLATHENVTKVLDYYQGTSFVEVQPITLAKGEPNLKHFQNHIIETDQMNKRLNEFIPYNDCLYRHMYKHTYLAAVDIDEVIMPLGMGNHWKNLTNSAKIIGQIQQPECKDGFAGICFQNVYFPEIDAQSDLDSNTNIPSYFNMLRRTNRALNHTDVNYNTKCLHNTAAARTLHNHFALTWLKVCRPLMLDPKVAQLNHYRVSFGNRSNHEEGFSKEKLIHDTSILRFQEELVSRTQKVLRTLGFLRS